MEEPTRSRLSVVPPAHPAKWSKPVLEAIGEIVDEEYRRQGRRWLRVLDPFVGVGRHDLDLTINRGERIGEVVGVELEPEWAEQDPDGETLVGDALHLAEQWGATFDIVVTSAVYPNRMTDHHDARDDSTRHTYRHYLGRPPSATSAAVLGWGPDYRAFHEVWLREAIRVLGLDALLVLNMKNHVSKVRGVDVEHAVVEWWVHALLLADCMIHEIRHVPTRGQGHGANGSKRTGGEKLIVVRTPKDRRLL